MKQILMRGMLLVFLALAFNQNAMAHVNYGDITNVGSTGIYDQFSPFGWAQGQIQYPTNLSINPQGALANTDDVNWYKFTLTQESYINLSLTSSDLAGAGTQLEAPAFSLYSGIFVNQSYDNDGTDLSAVVPTLVGERGLVNTAASFTLSTYTGVTSIDEANIRTVNFITGVTDGGTGTAALVNYLLGPGTYTVVAAGNSPYTLAADNSGALYGAIVAFTATPVPAPAAFWLMSTALTGLGLFGKRKGKLAV